MQTVCQSFRGHVFATLFAIMLAQFVAVPVTAEQPLATPQIETQSGALTTESIDNIDDQDSAETQNDSPSSTDPEADPLQQVATGDSSRLDDAWVSFSQWPAFEDDVAVPGSEIGYILEISNLGANQRFYSLWANSSPGASIDYGSSSITGIFGCESIHPSMLSCASNSGLDGGSNMSLWFTLSANSNISPEICSQPAPTISVEFYITTDNGAQQTWSHSIPLQCTSKPHLAINPVVRDSAHQEKFSAAEIGDQLELNVTLTNPHASQITVGHVATSSDAELHALSWTPGPAEAFAPGGPCAIDELGQVSCSNITLAASGQEGSSYTITLTSGPLTKSDMLCGLYSMSAAVTGGPSSGLANFDIACPPPIVTLPQVNLGTATCVETTGMVPMTLVGRANVDVPIVSQNSSTIAPDGNGVYRVQGGVETSVTFTRVSNVDWPDPLPVLLEGGTWHDDAAQPTFRFTPAELDCSVKLQITKTYWDRANNLVPSISSLAPGEIFTFRVEVKNVGITTVTGLQYSDTVAADLRWSTESPVLASMTYSAGQQCDVNAFDFVRGGRIAGTTFFGPSCQLLSGSEIAPGESVFFLYNGQVPQNPTSEQCGNGISDPAEITSVNGVATTIQSNNFTVRVKCGGSFVPLKTVKLDVSDGSSLEGATWKLYAPVASQADVPVYDQGVVGADNLIVFNKETPDGQYRLVIEPEGMAVIDRILDLRADQTEVVLQVDVDHDVQTPTATPSPTSSAEETPTSTPGTSETPTPSSEVTASPSTGATESGQVTGLPETGSGARAGTPGIIIAMGLSLVLLLAIGGIRRSTRMER